MKIDWCKFYAETNIYKHSILILKFQRKYFWLVGKLYIKAVPFMYNHVTLSVSTKFINFVHQQLIRSGHWDIHYNCTGRRVGTMHYYVNNVTSGTKNQRSSRLSAMDKYLSTLGLWRKPIARDGFCLFRATSEQVSLGYCAFDGKLQYICNVVIHVFCYMMQFNVLLLN